MPAAEFWDSTARELAAFMAGATERLQGLYRLQRYGGWIAEHFRRSKRLPRLESVLASPARRQPAGWSDQLAQVMAIHTLLTGKAAPPRAGLAP